MSEAGTVVYIVGAQHRPGELLHYIVVLVGALGRGDHGHFIVVVFAEFVNHKDRLKAPLIKKNGKFEEATWDEALTLVASKLKTYRSDEVGVISSARSTNEASYIMQKFARAVLGTNNMDHCARL